MMNKDCLKSLYTVRKKRIYLILAQILLLAIFLVTWELLASYDIIDEFLFSKPSAIWKMFVQYTKSLDILEHIYISVIETILGIVIGSSLGIIIASILWYFEILHKLLNPFLNVLNALPKTALAPIMIIWAGTGTSGIVVVAISILFVITILSTYNHFANIEPEKIKMMQSFNANRFQIFTKLIFPANLGNLFNVIKINIGMSWIGVIVGEFLVSRVGIGYLIMYGGQVFKLDLVMMGVIVLAICAFAMYLIVDTLEKFILKKRGGKK